MIVISFVCLLVERGRRKVKRNGEKQVGALPTQCDRKIPKEGGNIFMHASIVS